MRSTELSREGLGQARAGRAGNSPLQVLGTAIREREQADGVGSSSVQKFRRLLLNSNLFKLSGTAVYGQRPRQGPAALHQASAAP